MGAMIKSKYDSGGAKAILGALVREHVEFVVIGSMAMAAQGLPRATHDLDLFGHKTVPMPPGFVKPSVWETNDACPQVPLGDRDARSPAASASRSGQPPHRV
jgi:hypothetical protein